MVLGLLLPQTVQAQADQEREDRNLPTSLAGVGVEENLGGMLPRDATFLNAAGETVELADLLDGERPVLFNFIYHNCPMICSITLEALGMTLSEMDWTPGQEFDVVSVSFGAGETPEMAARAKERMIGKLDRPGAQEGWHFLVGDEANIAAITDAVGYQFKWVEQTQEYAHPAVLVFTSPDGKITRYLHGLDLPATDVRKALVEASQGAIGSAIDQIVMFCYRYDSDSNSYVIHATNLMKLGGMLTLIVMGLGLVVFWRRERADQDMLPRQQSQAQPS